MPHDWSVRASLQERLWKRKSDLGSGLNQTDGRRHIPIESEENVVERQTICK